jgi:hypothetical protein
MASAPSPASKFLQQTLRNKIKRNLWFVSGDNVADQDPKA